MRLSSRPNYPEHPSTQNIRPRRRLRDSLGRYIYLGLLAIACWSAAKWGYRRLRYVRIPGLLTGEEVSVQAHLEARVKKLAVNLGQQVERDQPLVFLDERKLEEKIFEQEQEIESLRVALAQEQIRLPQIIQRQETNLKLDLNRARKAEQRLLSQIKELKTELEGLMLLEREYEDRFSRAQQLLRLEAISYPSYQGRKLKLQELQQDIIRSQLDLEAAHNELVYQQKTIGLLFDVLKQAPQLERARSPIEVLRMRLDQSIEELRRLEASQIRWALSAPIAGLVTKLYKYEGEMVRVGEKVMALTDTKRLVVRGFLPADTGEEVRIGEVLEISFETGEESRGRVWRIYPAAEPVPPEFQTLYEPKQRARIVELKPLSRNSWPDIIGTKAFIRKIKSRWF